MLQSFKQAVAWFSIAMCSFIAIAWPLSCFGSIVAFWTVDKTRYEVASITSQCWLVVHQGWVWPDKLQWDVIPFGTGKFSFSSVRKWNGFQPESEFRSFGFEFTTGEFYSSFRPAPSDYPGPKNTMLGITTKFTAVGIPFWFCAILAATACVMTCRRVPASKSPDRDEHLDRYESTVRPAHERDCGER